MKQLFRRALVILLVAALCAANPGFEAFAATFAAPRLIPGGSTQAGAQAGAAFRPGATASALNLSASPVILTGSLSVSPSLSLSPSLSPSFLPLPSVPLDAAVSPAAEGFVPQWAAEPTAQSAVGTQEGLARTVESLNHGNDGARQPTLGQLFDGKTARPAADLSVSQGPSRPATTGLKAAEARSLSSDSEQQPPAGPATSFKRSLKVGFVAAVLPLAITFATLAVAGTLGYVPHSNYQSPMPETVNLATAGALFVGAAVMAPVAEEILFRTGIMGGLQKLLGPLPRLGEFWIPAAVSSLIFVAVHETADPLLFATRFVHAMIISYAFHKEGLPASMAAHGVFNGLLTLPVLLSFVLGPSLGALAALGLVPVSVYLAWRAWKSLKAEAPEVKSGKIIPLQLSARKAMFLAAMLVAGFFLLMPNIVWAAGAVGLLFYSWNTRNR